MSEIEISFFCRVNVIYELTFTHNLLSSPIKNKIHDAKTKLFIETAKGYRARQPSLFQSHHIEDEAAEKLKTEWRKLSRRTHGGDKAKDKRKEFRPLDKKR